VFQFSVLSAKKVWKERPCLKRRYAAQGKTLSTPKDGENKKAIRTTKPALFFLQKEEKGEKRSRVCTCGPGEKEGVFGIHLSQKRWDFACEKYVPPLSPILEGEEKLPFLSSFVDTKEEGCFFTFG